MTATVLGVLGRIEARHGHEAEAVEQLDQSQALAGRGGRRRARRGRACPAHADRCLVHNFLGQIRLSQGDPGWLHAYVPRAAHDDAVLAVLRSRLGDAAFAEACAWGGSIGGRNAVDYALQTG